MVIENLKEMFSSSVVPWSQTLTHHISTRRSNFFGEQQKKEVSSLFCLTPCQGSPHNFPQLHPPPGPPVPRSTPNILDGANPYFWWFFVGFPFRKNFPFLTAGSFSDDHKIRTWRSTNGEEIRHQSQTNGKFNKKSLYLLVNFYCNSLLRIITVWWMVKSW